MNKTLLSLLFGILVVPVYSQTDAFSSISGAATRGDGNTPLTGYSALSFTVGTSDILVDKLAYYDEAGDGLSSAHEVKIWSLNQSTFALTGTVASTTVAAGTAATLSGGFRYQTLGSALTLSANTTYLIGSYSFSGDGDNWFNNTSATFNSSYLSTSATQNLYYSSNGSAASLDPTNGPYSGYGPGFYWGAANFSASAIPEPSVYFAGIFSFGLLLGISRRIRRA